MITYRARCDLNIAIASDERIALEQLRTTLQRPSLGSRGSTYAVEWSTREIRDASVLRPECCAAAVSRQSARGRVRTPSQRVQAITDCSILRCKPCIR